MDEIRPRTMTQGEFAELLRENGFPACSKAAVSLAERPKESGVQFTPEARKAAHELLKSTRRAENRANPNKTTVWLDDDTRIWLEERAYMEDVSVGAVIRGIINEARTRGTDCHGALPLAMTEKGKAASGAGTSEAAGEPMERQTSNARPYGYSENITNEEENQDETLRN